MRVELNEGVWTPSAPEVVHRDARVERAVRDLAVIQDLGRFETARAVGEYVLTHFFPDGAPHGPDPRTNPSFGELARHPDLPFSKGTLNVAVRLVLQLRELPDDVGPRLSLAQHRALFPCREPETKRRLAERALEDKAAGDEVTEWVRAARGHAPRQGRPRLPAWYKTLKKSRSALESAMRFEPHSEHDGAVDADELHELLDGLEELQRKLHHRLRQLRMRHGDRRR